MFPSLIIINTLVLECSQGWTLWAYGVWRFIISTSDLWPSKAYLCMQSMSQAYCYLYHWGLPCTYFTKWFQTYSWNSKVGRMHLWFSKFTSTNSHRWPFCPSRIKDLSIVSNRSQFDENCYHWCSSCLCLMLPCFLPYRVSYRLHTKFTHNKHSKKFEKS